METPRINNATIVRFVLMLISMINLILGAFGVKALPIDDDTVSNLINVGFTVVMGFRVWWKDNDFTKRARERKAKMLAEEAKG